MKKLLLTLSVALSCGLLVLPAHALLTGVSGGVSTGLGTGGAGVLPAIIPAPQFAQNNNVTNLGMQGFNEAQGVTTSQAFATDGGGSIAAGTLVDSHMIFLNSSGGGNSNRINHLNVTWDFSGLILGVMSDEDGLLEFASTGELGNSGTIYQVSPLDNRGLEGGDSFGAGGVGSTFLTVSMVVTEPGDWIRVVTASNVSTVPEPGTILLLGSGLVGLGFWRLRKGPAA